MQMLLKDKALATNPRTLGDMNEATQRFAYPRKVCWPPPAEINHRAVSRCDTSRSMFTLSTVLLFSVCVE